MLLNLLCVVKERLTILKDEDDQDGDSQMLSSDSGNESDSMFPSANDPPTPQNLNAIALAQLRSSQLSPPDSQDPFNMNGSVPQEDLMDMSEQQLGEFSSTGLDTMVGPSNEQQKDADKEPGWAWKNKKAMDDYHRVMDQVLDKNFNLRMPACRFLVAGTDAMLPTGEFGDLFDESNTNGSS